MWGPQKGSKYILGSLAGEGGGASVYFNMIEPKQTSAFVKTMKKGMVFFDIGANVGYYSILAARLVGPSGRVYAFEPLMRNLAYLYQHTLLNRTRNVTIIPAACTDRIALEAFSAGDNFATGHLSQGNEDLDGLPVTTIGVDEFVQQAGVSPHVIKIDVEGAELSVLKGARNTLRDTKPDIFLSTHSKSLSESCLGYLEKHDYLYETLSPDKRNPSEFLAFHKAKSSLYRRELFHVWC
jgi:FkbM family methyltransferase